MSHSLHLSAIINDEKTLFKEEMNHYLETKLSELVSIVKTNVEETIDNKIQSIYKKASSVSYDDVLFNLDGSQILTDCVAFLEKHFNMYNNWSKEQILDEKRMIAKLLSITDKRCFALGRQGSLMPINGGQAGGYQRMICVYKHFMIEIINNLDYYRNPTNPNTEYYYKTIEHTLSNDILFAFKHFQPGYNGGICTTTLMKSPEWNNPVRYDNRGQREPNSYNTYQGLLEIMDIYKKHPEYFQQQCNEFELFCKKEHEEINNTKEQLKATILLYEDKLSKYTNFEEDKQTLEDELTFCRLDKIRLENEKQELETMKLTLNNEYHELELDKLELEKEKIRLKEDTKNRLENETQEIEIIRTRLDNEYHELQLEKMELEKEKLRLKEDTMKLQMEQRKLTKTQTSLATIQLSIDDASKALDKEINDLTYAKFIFEREKEEFARATQEDLQLQQLPVSAVITACKLYLD
jgi:hypothetical protein